jgi:prepilin-type N-terminal cleavage/methylation domain-containing protein
MNIGYASPRRAGFTVIEVVMAMAMIAIALLALMSEILSSMTLIEANRQDSLAVNAARDKVAEMSAKPFDKVFASFKSHTFPVPGLQAPGGGNPGRVLFPMSGGNLCETVVDPAMLMPRDLNLDGDATDTNVSTGYELLPTKIQVTWQTVQGPRTLELNVILTNYK